MKQKLKKTKLDRIVETQDLLVHSQNLLAKILEDKDELESTLITMMLLGQRLCDLETEERMKLH